MNRSKTFKPLAVDAHGAEPAGRLLFVTGCPRSGTTLVDKLLGLFEDVDSFSQPLPLLLVEAKRKFLSLIGHPAAMNPYPVSDQQFGNSYPIDDFAHFLSHRPFSQKEIQDLLDSMDNFSGQYFKTAAARRHAITWREISLAAFVQDYFAAFGRPARIAAWKEVYAEEYIPYLLMSGAHVLLIIRDPRDVAASLNCGNDIHAGRPRPLLWLIRQWRKSAAYALRYRAHPRVHVCRYEEIVRNPETSLERWREFLGPGPLPAWRRGDPLRDRSGATWLSNSSFDPQKTISTRGIGRHAELLPAKAVAFIEALCFVEMRVLGYAPKIARNPIEPAFLDKPDEVTGSGFLDNMAWSADRCEEEMDRWRRLVSACPDFSAAAFLFEESYALLRQQALST